jgi:hypothetical protein
MGYIAWLVKGSKKLNLNSSPYFLSEGFVPPAITEIPQIARGTSANRYGGGKLIDTRVTDFEYSFPVLISGSSSGQLSGARDRLRYFINSGTEAEPVYLCWKNDSDVPVDPLWGQWGATRRCKVLHANIYPSEYSYSSGDTRSKLMELDVQATVNPVEGLRQRVGNATGGILENNMFSPDGVSRGLMIPEATTNKCTNPVFGHATPANGWTTGSDLISATNTDKEFVYPDATNSIKLSCVVATASAFTFACTAGNTNTHTFSAYVKKADGTAATATDCKIYYNATKDSAYTYLGNGITRVHWSGAGIAAATATGVTITTVGATVYLMGYQAEEKAYPTPLCWGDLMGCAWTGTAHASTSTRTAGRWLIPTADYQNILNISEGTIVVVWQPDRASTAIPDDDVFLFFAGGMSAVYNGTNDDYGLTDGTNDIWTTGVTFSAFDIEILHFVFEQGSLKIYRNGSQVATGSTYTPYTFANNLYLGTDNNSVLHAGGTFLGFHTYPYAMNATEVANDATNISAHVNGGDGHGQALETIPWIYDNAGDNVIDNYCDATHWDWIISGGIPGSLPAETIFYILNSSDGRSLTISGHQSPIFHSPSNYFNADNTTTSTNTTAVLGKAINVAAAIHQDIAQYPMRLWVSLTDAGSNLTIAPRVELNTNSVGHTGDYRPIVADATGKDFITYDLGNISNPKMEYGLVNKSHYGPIIDFGSVDYELWLQRTVAGAANVVIDYMRVMFGTNTYIYNDVASDSALILVHGHKALILDTTATPNVTKITEIQGELFELYPGTLNHIVLQTGDLGANTVTTATTTIQAIYVTPRWALA